MKKMFVISVLLTLALVVPAFAETNIDINTSKSISKAEGQSIGNITEFTSPQMLPNAMPIIPFPIPLIQGGRVGDVTGQVVDFAIAARPYAKGMRVVKVLKVVKGSIFGRTRLEDIEIDVLSSYQALVNNGKVNPNKIAYIIQYKDSAMGAGIGGGGAASASGLSTPTLGATGSAAILPGYTRSTADPAYFIKWFLIE